MRVCETVVAPWHVRVERVELLPILGNLGLIVLGILLLYYGGEFLVDNASKLANKLGVSALVIGLTVVAFGTSAPELAASVTAALQGFPDLSVGNIVGSNIANLALVLGIAALVYPLATTARFVRREVPFMIGTSLLLLPFSLNGNIGRIEGLILVALLGFFLWFLLREGETAEIEEVEAELKEEGAQQVSTLRLSLFAALGIGLLVGGAQVLVEGASNLAEAFGINERIIGITLVALGTSLPELASSVVAALKKEGDIIIGNLIGSNVFNVLSIIGITTIIQPLSVRPEWQNVDFWIMIGVSLLTLVFLAVGLRVGRAKGGVLVAVYVAYIAYIAYTVFNQAPVA
jgi:cation:H+ antiporter